MTPTVWLNQHLSNTWHALRLMARERRPEEFRLLCSHKWRRYPAARFSDAFETEPRHTTDAHYVEFCLETAKKHAVDLFYPWRKLGAILKARQRFADLGVRLLAVADAATLKLLDSKVRQYRALIPELVPLPDYVLVNTVAEFDAAVTRLRAGGRRVCYKPAVSIFGFGFHILTGSAAGRRRWQAGDPVLIPLDAARQALPAKEPFADLLVMPYLPGPERSIDCLADNGNLLRCIIRRKSMKNHRRQVVEQNDAIAAIARRLTAHFRLNAVFNIQLRDDGGTSYLLEINPRMSGGIPSACHTGLNLPYWAIRYALGTAAPDDIPWPQTGIHVDSADFPGSR